MVSWVVVALGAVAYFGFRRVCPARVTRGILFVSRPYGARTAGIAPAVIQIRAKEDVAAVENAGGMLFVVVVLGADWMARDNMFVNGENCAEEEYGYVVRFASDQVVSFHVAALWLLRFRVMEFVAHRGIGIIRVYGDSFVEDWVLLVSYGFAMVDRVGDSAAACA